MITNLFHFFTTWVLILTIYNDITSKYFNLTFLSAFTLIFGIFFLHVYPRYSVFVFNDKEYKIEGLSIFIDDIFHLLIFMANYNKFGFSMDNILNSILLFVLYIITVDFNTIYRLNLEKI